MKNRQQRGDGSIIALAISLILFGLGFAFLVPQYINSAPDWYKQLPSVLPPHLWAPAAQCSGGFFALVGIGLLAVVFMTAKSTKALTGTVSSRPYGKRITVFVVHPDETLLTNAAVPLQHLKQKLEVELNLQQLSVLRYLDVNEALEQLDKPSESVNLLIAYVQLRNAQEMLRITDVADVVKLAWIQSTDDVEDVLDYVKHVVRMAVS